MRKSTQHFLEREGVQGWLMIAPNTLGLLVFYLIPIGWSIVLSFFSWDGLSPMQFAGLSNLCGLFSDASFLLSVRNTLIYCFFVVPAIVVLILVFGMLLTRNRKGVSFLRTLYFLPTMTMPVAAALIWKWLLNSQYGLVNQVLAFLGITPIIWLTDVHHILFCVMLVGIWLGVAYDLIIIIAGIKGIPQMYYEAAEIDGASSAYQFFFITLPLVTPSLFFIVITQMINSFKVFDSASVILGVDPPLSLWNAGSTIVMHIYQDGFVSFNMGYSAAESFFLFLMVLIITILQFKVQKKWVHYA